MNEKTKNERKKYVKVDFKKVVDSVDWSKEVSTKDVLMAINESHNLHGREKYVVNSASSYYIMKRFEEFCGAEISKRVDGISRNTYYCNPKALKEAMREKEEAKKREKEAEAKITCPSETIESVKEEKVAGEKRAKRSFPDSETLEKAEFILSILEWGEGLVSSSGVKERREKFHPEWKRQRSVGKKSYTIWQEVEKLFEFLEIESHLSVGRKFISWAGDMESLKKSLVIIRDFIGKKPEPEIKEDEIVEEKITPVVEEPKEVEVVAEKPAEPIKPLPKTEEPKRAAITGGIAGITTITKRPRIKVIQSSPIVGKSRCEEAKATFIPNENKRFVFAKVLLAETINRSAEGSYFAFEGLAQLIKKLRYVEFSGRDIRDTVNYVNVQFPGIFMDITDKGFKIGSVARVAELRKMYRCEERSETIWMRLNQSLKELETMYPDLKFKEDEESQNIYEVEVNYSESAEKAFAKLVYCMRPSEKAFAQETHWLLRRARVMIEKSGMDIYHPVVW